MTYQLFIRKFSHNDEFGFYPQKGFLCWFVSGIAVGVIATAVASPADNIKTVYIDKSHLYKNLYMCVRDKWVNEGWKSFYNGAFYNGTRLVIWNVVMFVSFKYFKEGVDIMRNNETNQINQRQR